MENNLFAERLRTAMKQAGIKSARELSRMTNLTEVTVSRYLSGKRMPNAADLPTIATAVGTSCDYLLGMSEMQKQKTTNTKTIKVVLSTCYQIGETEYTQIYKTVPLSIPDDKCNWHVAGEAVD